MQQQQSSEMGAEVRALFVSLSPSLSLSEQFIIVWHVHGSFVHLTPRHF